MGEWMINKDEVNKLKAIMHQHWVRHQRAEFDKSNMIITGIHEREGQLGMAAADD